MRNLHVLFMRIPKILAILTSQESVNMVKSNNNAGRVFSLGIGEGASRVLVNGLARSGNVYEQSSHQLLYFIAFGCV